ncbi:protein RoBo-1-like isoform X1 [Peromyscus maniculatus bairdii]|uniref:protein RoBo-1-like isoform X1 n=1 Tax=Peromyscus maniculatus bairdii TaxID=230844 RepID=UPI00042AEB9B|nr:protein RoBo-1-like [Peromyscus maniculatus bairdii]
MSWSSVLKSLLAVCICTHLSVSSVESYACDNRKCYNGRCESNPKCQSTKGCFFHVQELKEQNNPFGSLKIKDISCSEDECTELAFSTTLGGQRTFSYDHQCCYTEQCNTMSKRDDPFPSSKPQPNGVECPACYSEDGKCEPVPLKCTGLETKCVVVFGTALIKGPVCSIIRGMGCATETACGLQNLTILENAKIETFCSSESPPLRSFSSALTCLFLIKALL